MSEKRSLRERNVVRYDLIEAQTDDRILALLSEEPKPAPIDKPSKANGASKPRPQMVTLPSLKKGGLSAADPAAPEPSKPKQNGAAKAGTAKKSAANGAGKKGRTPDQDGHDGPYESSSSSSSGSEGGLESGPEKTSKKKPASKKKEGDKKKSATPGKIGRPRKDAAEGEKKKENPRETMRLPGKDYSKAPADAIPHNSPLTIEPLINQYLKKSKQVLGRLRRDDMAIKTYTADMNKGGSRERISQSYQIFRCCLSIARSQCNLRTLIQQLEGTDTPIPADKYDEEGLDLEAVFCSRCLITDDDETNDILLCDNPDCNRAYHQGCLDPPPVINEEDEEEWLCPVCRVKEEILEELGEYYGIEHPPNAASTSLFPGTEEAAAELQAYETELKQRPRQRQRPNNTYVSESEEEMEEEGGVEKTRAQKTYLGLPANVAAIVEQYVDESNHRSYLGTELSEELRPREEEDEGKKKKDKKKRREEKKVVVVLDPLGEPSDSEPLNPELMPKMGSVDSSDSSESDSDAKSVGTKGKGGLNWLEFVKDGKIEDDDSEDDSDFVVGRDELNKATGSELDEDEEDESGSGSGSDSEDDDGSSGSGSSYYDSDSAAFDSTPSGSEDEEEEEEGDELAGLIAKEGGEEDGELG